MKLLTMQYTLNLEHYNGPLEKLLELVEKNELDISLISLAKVTGGFLDHLSKLQEKDTPHAILADFLVVASKLLLIKSKALIPTLELEEEDEEDIQNLETQLKIYKKIKLAKELIKDGWREMPAMTSRELLMTKEAFFYPPKTLKIKDLADAFKKIVQEIEKFRTVEVIKTEIINLEKKIKEIVQRITSMPAELKTFSGGNSKKELIVLFLAILHLLREEIIEVEQTKPFGEIHIAKKG